MKRILILGVTGQDGSYAADLFLNKKFEVHGMVRKSATSNTSNIDHIINDKTLMNKSFFIHHGDLLDSLRILEIIKYVKPDEIYNFADQDHVKWSFEIPSYSYNVTTNAVLQIFEILKSFPKIKFFQPLSSNIFGITNENKQSEKSKLHPMSIYALGKTSLYHAINLYREVFKLKIYSAIFFNHESPRRTVEYVSRKITYNACKIYKKEFNNIYLGNIDVSVDWGYAPDYVEAANKIMNLKSPSTIVIGTGKLTTLRNFLKLSFEYLGLDYRNHLKIDKKFFRPSNTSPLCADNRMAKKLINFTVKTDIKKLVKIMIDNDLSKT